jgi:hypothetical protein
MKKWKFMPAVEAFPRYREEWDLLNRAQGNHILLDSRFVLPLLRHFGTAKTMLGICRNGQMCGMVLLDSITPGLLRTFQPSQAPLGLFLLSTGAAIYEQLTELTQSLPPYVLGVAVLQQDCEFSIMARADRPRWIQRIEYIQTSRILIGESFEEYWQGRSKSFVADLARRIRRMEREKLAVEFDVISDPIKVEECIKEFGRMESAGWKGKEGTAVSSDNSQGRFYLDVLRSFCERGEGRIYCLKINGKTVACDLSFQRNRICVDLKTAFDEQYKMYSVGSLLMMHRLMHTFSDNKIKSVEFYGRANDWSRKWTSEIRPICHYNVYRFRWLAEAHLWLRLRTLGHLSGVAK